MTDLKTGPFGGIKTLIERLREWGGLDFVEAIDLMTEAADTLERMQWNPDMEAAPKDGTEILCSEGYDALRAVCWHKDGQWIYGDDIGDEDNFPTMQPSLWMPLPPE